MYEWDKWVEVKDEDIKEGLFDEFQEPFATSR